jgi:DNA-binding transcriptional MerR regulator
MTAEENDTGGSDGASPQPDDDTPISIGELAEQFKVTTRTIRFYEARGLLTPARHGTSRSYTRRDVARLTLILRGKNLGFSLEDIAEYLSLYDSDPAQKAQTALLMQKVDAHLASLQQKRADIDRTLRELREIRAQCAAHLKRGG